MTIRWGIMATGWIAEAFAEGLQYVTDSQLIAVGSRSQRSADDFAERFHIPNRHASYEALANDPDVDVVYIATPHGMHYENMLMCLNAGKHVLCEKAFTLNARQAAEVIALARAKKLFLMEAMWTRFLPAVVELRRILLSGVIGEVRAFQADFSFPPRFDPKSRLFDPALGGGSLLDLGVYPVSFTSMLFGEPERIVSAAHLGITGVDMQMGAVMIYPDGKLAMAFSSLECNGANRAAIQGRLGRIEIAREFFHPEQFSVILQDGSREDYTFPIEGNGYRYEAQEVVERLLAGELESPVMPLDETLAIMRMMDTMRAQWGMVYPNVD